MTRFMTVTPPKSKYLPRWVLGLMAGWLASILAGLHRVSRLVVSHQTFNFNVAK